MTPFYAKAKNRRVMVIDIVVLPEDGPAAVYIDELGRLGSAELASVWVEFDGQWRPASWPFWPPEDAQP